MHAAGVMTLAAQKVPAGGAAVQAGFKRGAAPAVCLGNLQHYPYLLGDGEQAREAAAWVAAAPGRWVLGSAI